MSSVVDISFSVFEKFNPTETEVKQLIAKLNTMLSQEVVVKPVKMTEDELYAHNVEMKLKSMLFPPNDVRF